MTAKSIRKTGLWLALIGLLMIGPKAMIQYNLVSVPVSMGTWATVFAMVGFIVAPVGFMLIVNAKTISGDRYDQA